MSQIIAAPNPEKNLSQVNEQGRLLEEAISRLESLLVALETKLAPVATPRTAVDAPPDPPEAELVPVANMIRSMRHRLNINCGQITEILDRIEV